MPTDEATPCDSCRGTGKSYVHLNYGQRGGEWKWIDCLICEGAGALSGEKRLRVEAGRRLRDRRKAERRWCGAEAKRLGIDEVELSKAEMGRLPLGRLREIEALGRGPGPGGGA